MSENPFRNQGRRGPADDLQIDGKSITGPAAGGGGANDQTAVAFDASAQTVSPAGQSMIAHILAMVKSELDARDRRIFDTVADTMVEHTAEQLQPLQQALGVEKDRVTNAIRQVVSDFVAPDESPTLDELETAAAQHKKDMKNV